MAVSTLFLNNISCVDHAYIDRSGRVVGGSYHPNIEVSGEVESTENVVIDFSRVKKELKGLIDHKDTGYDHKLWIIPGYSSCAYAIDGDMIIIESLGLSLSMPKNAVKIFSNEKNENCSFNDVLELEFNSYLTDGLINLHPNLNIQVNVEITTNAFTRTDEHFMFRYAHGLKNSSSWGCQNHSHGHLSFIEFEGAKREWLDDLSDSVTEIDNTLFIFRDNIVGETEENISIEYTTERGTFKATYKKRGMKYEILDTETTIEFISEWFVKKNIKLLTDAGVKRVFVSEGLSKGAVVTL